MVALLGTRGKSFLFYVFGDFVGLLFFYWEFFGLLFVFSQHLLGKMWRDRSSSARAAQKHPYLPHRTNIYRVKLDLEIFVIGTF